MESSTPISNHDKLKPQIKKIDQNETVVDNCTVSQFFDNVSPIKKKKKKKRQIQINNGDDNVNSTFQDFELKKKHCLTVDNIDIQDKNSLTVENVPSYSEEFEKSLLSDGSTNIDSSWTDELDCSLTDEFDCSLTDEINLENIKDTICELRQAVPMYINKLKNIDISCQWELSETLAPEKGIYKSKNGLKGKLEPEEQSFLKKRLVQFCEEHKINFASIRMCMSDKITKFSFPNEVRLKFIQFLCKDYVNDRNPLSLYRSILKMGLRKGKFKEKEVNFLIEMYENYRGSNFHSVCGLLLNRHRHNIYLKVCRLKKKNILGARPSASNAKNKSSKLRKLLLKNILMRKNFELPLLKNLNSKTWKSIGREYNMSPAVAKAIYICDIMPQMFANHPIKFTKFFIKLIYSIHDSEWETWENVNWNQLSSKLYDTGPFFVYTMLRKVVMNYVPKEQWKNFKECSDYLYQNVLPRFENGIIERTEKKLNKVIIQKNNMDP